MPKHIYLKDGHSAIVDDEDYEWLSRIRWYIRYAKANKKGKLYARTGGNTTIQMHRMILNAPEGMQVDHINGDGLDNRRVNLRLCTAQQNQRNRIHTSKTGFKGVKLDHGRYSSRVKIDGVTHYLGCYATPEEAARRYDEVVNKIDAVFFKLNFPLSEAN